MKVLGETRDGYICEVSHSEIEKFLDLYYGKKTGLKVGEEVDLGTGYDWSSKISSALHQTQEFVKANKPIIQSLMEGYSVLTALGKESE
jgi:hypothetical protein